MKKKPDFLKLKLITLSWNFCNLRFVLGSLIILLFICSCTDKDATTVQSTNKKNIPIDKVLKDFYQSEVKNNPAFKIIKKNTANTDPQYASSCEPPDLGSGYTCSTIHIVTTVSIPATTDCPACGTVNVGFDLRICQNSSGVLFFSFYNFGVIPDNSCATWWACIGSLSSAGADRAIEEMRQEASLALERTVVSYWVNLYSPLCPNVVYSSDFALETCYETCVTPITQAPYYSLELIYCGNKCCIRTRTFCKELDGRITISSANYQTVGSSDCSTGSNCSVFSSGCYDRPCGTH